MPSFRLEELAAWVGGEVKGDKACLIQAIAPIQSAQPGQISFLDNPRYRQYLAKTQAAAVIVAPKFLADCPVNALVVSDPYLAYAQIARYFENKPKLTPGIDPSAQIDQRASIDPSASIGPLVVIGPHVVIGSGVQIGPGCVIGADCHIGAHSIINANVTLYYNCRLGERVHLHSGVVIGADGFGLAKGDGCWQSVPQLGGVRIGNDVDVGANTTIDRGALTDTEIGDGVKIDNLVQIAHNVKIGDHTVIAGCTGVSGSSTIGRHCIIGGGVCISGHLDIADHIVITGDTTVHNSLTEPGIYSSGTTAEPHRSWSRNTVRFRQLEQMAKRLAALEKTVGALNHE